MASRIGPHVIRPSPEAMNWATRAPIVKAMDCLEPLRAARWDAVRVFRHFFANQDLLRNPGDVAIEILDALQGYHHSKLFVEIYNEVRKEDTVLYADLLETVTAILHAGGYKVAGPSWSTGDYEAEQWNYLRSRDFCDMDAVNLHAYWGNQGHTPWHSLRYRAFWRAGDPPVIISECGRDNVEGGGRGWKASGVSPEQYLAELRAYDAEIGRDSYVLGATAFTAGPTPDWDAFSMDGLDTSGFSGAGAVIPIPIRKVTVADYTSPNHGPARAKTLGIVVHSTRSSQDITLEEEFDRTVSWLNNPAAEVSAHAIVSPTRVHRSVALSVEAWHARELNATHLGIELTQPKASTVVPDSVLRRAANEVAPWCVKYGIPLEWNLTRGFVQHKDTVSGHREGKSDVGSQAVFDGSKFMVYVKAAVVALKPKPPVDKVTDALNGIWHFAAQAEAAADLPTAKQNIVEMRKEVVELKTALGK